MLFSNMNLFLLQKYKAWKPEEKKKKVTSIWLVLYFQKMVPRFSNSPHIAGKVLNQILKNFLQIFIHLMKEKGKI